MNWTNVVVAMTLTACSGSVQRPSAPQPPADARPASFTETWGLLSSRRFSLDVPVPDPAGWRTDDAKDPWFVGVHSKTRSAVFARTWRAAQLMTAATCEAEARKLRPDLLGADDSAFEARHAVAAPAGYDSRVGVSVRRTKTGLLGLALSAGASLRDCVVLVFATRADGDHAAELIGERLALMTELGFGRASIRKVESRVVPEPRRDEPARTP